MRQAVLARERAESCLDTNTRNEWLRIAVLWDELCKNYEEFQKVRDRALSAEPIPKTLK